MNIGTSQASRNDSIGDDGMDKTLNGRNKLTKKGKQNQCETQKNHM